MTQPGSPYFAIFLYDFVFIVNCSLTKLAAPDGVVPVPTPGSGKQHDNPQSPSSTPSNFSQWGYYGDIEIELQHRPNRSYGGGTTSIQSSPIAISSTMATSDRTPTDEHVSDFITTTDMKVARVSNEINEFISTVAEGTKDDRTLLTDLDKLADSVTSNFTKNSTTFKISSWVSTINKNETSVIEHEDSGTRITLLAAGIRDLKADSVVKIVIFKTANGSANDLVVVKAISIKNESSFSERPILQIQFEVDGFGWMCAYWDYGEHKWRDDGIATTYIRENHTVICLSSHLSSFSVVIDPKSIDPEMLLPVDSEHERILTCISIVGSALSIPCLFIVLVVHHNRRTINETNKILFNSCVAFLLVHISYQLYSWLPDSINCAAINFTMHFSVLSFLLWTASDGINMLRILFTDVFNTNGYIFYRWYKIVSWGFPGVASAIGIVLFDNRDRNKCRLYFNRHIDQFLYFIPCTLVLACNLSLFCWMLIKVTCRNSLGRLKEKKLDYILAMTQVFGMAWCIAFPLLWFSATRIIGEYLFAVLVSTEGILVFVVRCANDRNWRRHFMSNVYSLNKPLSTSSRSRTGGGAARTSNPTLSGLSDKS